MPNLTLTEVVDSLREERGLYFDLSLLTPEQIKPWRAALRKAAQARGMKVRSLVREQALIIEWIDAPPRTVAEQLVGQMHVANVMERIMTQTDEEMQAAARRTAREILRARAVSLIEGAPFAEKG
jgi:hypothetical protein